MCGGEGGLIVRVAGQIEGMACDASDNLFVNVDLPTQNSLIICRPDGTLLCDPGILLDENCKLLVHQDHLYIAQRDHVKRYPLTQLLTQH